MSCDLIRREYFLSSSSTNTSHLLFSRPCLVLSCTVLLYNIHTYIHHLYFNTPTSHNYFLQSWWRVHWLPLQPIQVRAMPRLFREFPSYPNLFSLCVLQGLCYCWLPPLYRLTLLVHYYQQLLHKLCSNIFRDKTIARLKWYQWGDILYSQISCQGFSPPKEASFRW